MAYEKELEAALRAVVKGIELCRGVQSSLADSESTSKKDSSPVTIADYGSQAVINIELERSFPDDTIVSEEDSSGLQHGPGALLAAKVLELVDPFCPGIGPSRLMSAIDHGTRGSTGAERFWTLDPIDGTRGFMRGEQYAVALALIEGGNVVLSVLGCPQMHAGPGAGSKDPGAVFYATRGGGAFCTTPDLARPRKIRVSTNADPTAIRLMESAEAGHSSREGSARVVRELGIVEPPLRMDGQGKYAAVARGEASAYLRLPVSEGYREKVWDHAAGWLMVKEAGGEVTDILGRSIDFSVITPPTNELETTGIVATNGLVHDLVLEAVRKVIT